MRLTQIIEALLFASDAPLSAADLSRVDEQLDEDTVEAVIQELRSEYEQGERSFQIYEVAGGYQLLTRPEFVTVLERYDSVPQPSRLSAPALEVLAIIAYRQPLGRVEIEEIRGVGSSGVLRTLTERNLVEPVGRGEGLGRPLLYGTTKKFLEHFGFRSLEDLPRPDELPIVLRERPRTTEAAAPGEAAGETEGASEAAAGSDAAAAGEAAAGSEVAGSGDAAVASAEGRGAETAAAEDQAGAGTAEEAASESATDDGEDAAASDADAGRNAGADPDPQAAADLDADADTGTDLHAHSGEDAEAREGVRG